MNRRSRPFVVLAGVAAVGAVALLTVPVHAGTGNVVLSNNKYRNGDSCGSLLTHPSPTYPLLSSRIQVVGVTGPSDPCLACRSTAWWELGGLVALALVLLAATALPAEGAPAADPSEV